MKYAISAAVLASAAIAVPASAHEVNAEYASTVIARALPASMQADAGIRIEGEDGEMTWAREGTNGMTCTLSSVDTDGAENRLNIACMPDEVVAMGPAMDEIRSATSSREEFMAAVASAIEDGTLTQPAAGTTGYLWRGAADTWALAPEALEGSGWQIVFTPFATGADLNLLEEPEGTMPWVMASGTPFAHIMVFGSSD